MLAKERQNQILEYLKQNKIISITEIVKRFDVSHETARRDLEYLKDQNLVKRIHGGAVFEENSSADSIAYTDQGTLGYVERAAIGQAAAELVSTGDSVLLGMGSTVLEVAKNLKQKSNITVITNAIPIIMELIRTEVDVHILGGRLNHDELNITGYTVRDTLSKYYVDKAFISAGGITFQNGISDYSSDDAEFIRMITERAKTVILVAQSNKFGVNAFASECSLKNIDIVVSDKNLSEEYVRGIQELGISLILADLPENLDTP